MRNALVLALLCAAALSACNKPQEEMGLVNWEKAPPLLAGIDEGALPAEAGGPINPAGDAAAAGAGATNAVATAPAAPAAPGTVPIRKAGLWQTTADNGRGPQTSTLCVTAETEARRGVFGAGRGQGCAPKIAKSGAAWTATVSCTRNMGDQSVKMDSTETLTGDLSTSYKIAGKSTTTGGPEGMGGTRNIAASGVYKGACPAGQKGGDMVTAQGEKRNISDQPQGGGGGRRGQ